MPNAFPFAAFVSARVRLKVVASLKVTPRLEFADVCSTSLRKMSSWSLSGSESLLRMTVAVPVSVATLPIGSSAGACVAEAGGGAGEGKGDATGRAGAVGKGKGVGKGAGWVCASFVAPTLASTLGGAKAASMAKAVA